MTVRPAERADQAERAIRAGRIVAIVRLPRLSEVAATAITETLVSSGVTAMEFTLTTENALRAVTAARAVVGERAVIGAGTVLSVREVEEAADAGAQFIVSPDVNVDVIEATVRRGMLSLPGAFTATEVRRAVEAGAAMVKLFPAGPGGVEYLKALRGPLPEVAFVPTGGIDVTSVADFLGAGAVAVALGSGLVSSAEDLSGLADRARRAVESAGGAR
ncbi:bifunctional 4-hydroxy-2-oxoglutarate aldolase/2-dehydro-3-deoxy-phosphogluconate aldolase [Terrabacter terrigena]